MVLKVEVLIAVLVTILLQANQKYISFNDYYSSFVQFENLFSIVPNFVLIRSHGLNHGTLKQRFDILFCFLLLFPPTESP